MSPLNGANRHNCFSYC
uniref:Uncharacterized protein n=1 Tax=Anguilla anguilla TaxID=7936 RepID=A0A0E9P8Y7_ANGAN